MTLDEFASRLKNPKAKAIKGCPGYKACCPAHADTNPSFNVWQGDDDYIHVRCHAGCSEDQILSSLGLTQEDRKVKTPVAVAASGETVYRYTDELGAYLFEKYRPAKPKPDGPKLSQRRWAGDHFEYTLDALNGQSKTLYRLGEVLSAVASKRRVWINEGEKAVEAFRLKREVATCQPSGAGPGKWLPQHSAIFRGAKVIIVADRDEVGEAYAGEVAISLLDVAESVQVVQSKTTKAKDDAYDHFMEGGTMDDFVPRPDLIKVHIPGLAQIDFSKFVPVVRDYLWEPYFWFGQCCMFTADSGIGKSTVALAIGASFSIGVIPNGGGPTDPVQMLYCIGDADTWEEYITLYQAMGGRMEAPWAEAIQGIRPLDQLCREITSYCKTHPLCRYVVIDPIMNFVGAQRGKAIDMKNEVDAVQMIGMVADLARQLGIVILMIHHDNKLGEYLGSAMIKARVRGYIHAGWHPDMKGVVLVEDRKGSILTPRGDPFAFRRIGNTIEYLTDFVKPGERAKPGPKSESLDAAKDAIFKVLAHGPVHYEEARKTVINMSGCSQATVYRAAKAMGINTGVGGDPMWSIPTNYDHYADASDYSGVYRGGD